MSIPVVVSFDVGIKNLAICVLALDGSRLFSWKSLNLLQEDRVNISHKCGCCKKRAFFYYSDRYFCKKHGEGVEGLFMPVCGLNKMKKDELLQLWKTKLGLLQDKGEICKDNKPGLLKDKPGLLKDIVDHMLKPITTVVKKSASSESLIEIAKNMTKMLDSLFSEILERNVGLDIRHVLIENQISTIAARMKTLQGMLTEYFVIRYPSCLIRYVSSSNKLSALNKGSSVGGSSSSVVNVLEKDTELELESKTGGVVSGKNEYKTHKLDAVQLCREKLLEGKIAGSAEWMVWFESFKKRDDLADSLLQGLWFLLTKDGG
jgi:hypothetical protein